MSNVQPPYPGDSDKPDSDTASEGLPQFPGSTPGYGQAPAEIPQPSSIQNAVRLMWVGAGLSVIGLIITLASLGSMKDEIREQLIASGEEVTDEIVNAAYGVAIFAGVVIGIIGVLLWLWMAWKNGQGRSWARIVATVLGVLNVLSTVYTSTAGTAPPLATIVSIINVILAVTILFLLWRKESSDFYDAHTRARQLH